MNKLQLHSKNRVSRPLTLQLPTEAVDQIKAVAKRQDRSMSALVRVAISHYLATGGAK